MLKKAAQFPFPFLVFFFFYLQIVSVIVRGATTFDDHHEDVSSVGKLVRKDQRVSLFSTEDGDISAVEISDGARGHYHLEFITLEPNSLFLPVLLHADMVFYVHTGSGRLSWVDGDQDEMRRVNLRRGDVYRMQPGTVFFAQSSLEPERQKLRIYAIFANSMEDLHEPSMGAYSSIRDLVLGFDKKVLQAAFKVPEEVIEELRAGTIQAPIVHAPPTEGRTFWEFEAQFMKALLGSRGYSMFDVNKKKHKTQTFNLLKAKPDFENCNGWSLTVTKKDLNALRGSNIGLFMVNLTRGSMMGPHWNPMASEISVVIHGQGMVRVVCPRLMNESECKHAGFRVEEGDVFAVPRFHPMAQMAFNNDSFVFMGFSSTTKKNHPQFLAGKASVLQTLNKEFLAASFNVTNTTISQLLAAQAESIILECISCAEEEERKMEEEIEKERAEARKREEEEARKREEEKRREEEEVRKREEEEAKREEEERRRREEEEARKREEEEEKRRQEEEKEEEARRSEEEKRKQEEEEEEEARRSEEEKRKQEEEEEEEARRREEEEEEEEARRREEEKRRQEEEEQEEEEEEAARRGEEEEAEEEERRKEQKREKERSQEEAEREEEEARRQEEEREEMERREEKARRERERQEEEEEAKRQEEEEQEVEEEERGERRRVLKKMLNV